MMLEQIRNYRLQSTERLLSSIGDSTEDSIEKAISVEEFDQRYSAGYNVYTTECLDLFTSDCIEKGISPEEIHKATSSLSRVLIKKGEEISPIYVERYKEEDILPESQEDEPESDIQKARETLGIQ